ncbi:MAG: flagellar hook associated protein, partial [Pseudomonadota bacterium]
MNAPLTPEFQVNTFISGNQTDPEIATLLDGTYVVVWTSADQDGSGNGVVAQRYSAEGAPLGLPFIVNSNAASVQDDPAVAATADGGFVVVWESASQDAPGSSSRGVFGQAYQADGTPAGDEFQVNVANTTRDQVNAAIVGLPGGGFAVA